mmetsp:Transcript_21980/g.87245  ORF Transcript_21980/g.87245 Transcript_21980/m.87245 type:complete len:436 (+) Transcript_21980:122-1429(+)
MTNPTLAVASSSPAVTARDMNASIWSGAPSTSTSSVGTVALAASNAAFASSNEPIGDVLALAVPKPYATHLPAGSSHGASANPSAQAAPLMTPAPSSSWSLRPTSSDDDAAAGATITAAASLTIRDATSPADARLGAAYALPNGPAGAAAASSSVGVDDAASSAVVPSAAASPALAAGEVLRSSRACVSSHASTSARSLSDPAYASPGPPDAASTATNRVCDDDAVPSSSSAASPSHVAALASLDESSTSVNRPRNVAASDFARAPVWLRSVTRTAAGRTPPFDAATAASTASLPRLTRSDGKTLPETHLLSSLTENRSDNGASTMSRVGLPVYGFVVASPPNPYTAGSRVIPSRFPTLRPTSASVTSIAATFTPRLAPSSSAAAITGSATRPHASHSSDDVYSDTTHTAASSLRTRVSKSAMLEKSVSTYADAS